MATRGFPCSVRWPCLLSIRGASLVCEHHLPRTRPHRAGTQSRCSPFGGAGSSEALSQAHLHFLQCCGGLRLRIKVSVPSASLIRSLLCELCCANYHFNIAPVSCPSILITWKRFSFLILIKTQPFHVREKRPACFERSILLTVQPELHADKTPHCYTTAKSCRIADPPPPRMHRVF